MFQVSHHEPPPPEKKHPFQLASSHLALENPHPKNLRFVSARVLNTTGWTGTLETWPGSGKFFGGKGRWGTP